MEGNGGESERGGGALLPTRVKRPTIIRPVHRLPTGGTGESVQPQPVPARPAPPRPSVSLPPNRSQKASDVTTDQAIGDREDLQVVNGAKSPSSSKDGDSSKRKLEITIVDARPMSEMGFRGEKGSSPSASATQPPSLPSRPHCPVSNASGLPPPRPESLAGSQPPESGRPKRPTIIRPGSHIKQDQDCEPKESEAPARPARPSVKPPQKPPFSVPRKNSNPSNDTSNNSSAPPILTQPAAFRPQTSLRSKKEDPVSKQVHSNRPARPPSILTCPSAGSTTMPVPASRPNPSPQPRPRSRIIPTEVNPGFGEGSHSSGNTPTSTSSQESETLQEKAEPVYCKINKTEDSSPKLGKNLVEESKSVFPVKLRPTVPVVNPKSDESSTSNENDAMTQRNSGGETKKPPPPLKAKPKPKPKPKPGGSATEPNRNSDKSENMSEDRRSPVLLKDLSPNQSSQLLSSQRSPENKDGSLDSSDSVSAKVQLRPKSKPTTPIIGEEQIKPKKDNAQEENLPPMQPKQLSNAFLARFEQLSIVKDDSKVGLSKPPASAKRPFTIIGGPRQSRPMSCDKDNEPKRLTPTALEEKDGRSTESENPPPPVPTKRPITIIGTRSIGSIRKRPNETEPLETDIDQEITTEHEQSENDSPQPKAPSPTAKPSPPMSKPRGDVQLDKEKVIEPLPGSTSSQSLLTPSQPAASAPSRPTQPPAPSRPLHQPSKPPSDHPASQQKSTSQSQLLKPKDTASYPDTPSSQPSSHNESSVSSLSPPESGRKDSICKQQQLLNEEPVKRRQKPARPGAGPSRPLSLTASGSMSQVKASTPTANEREDSTVQPSMPSPPTMRKKPKALPNLPPRPSPGHPLYHYMSDQPHGIAMHDYTASQDDEISFLEGDTIVLVDQVNENWMIGSASGEEGMFPVAFVKIKVPLKEGKSLQSKWQESLDAGPISADKLRTAEQKKADVMTGPRCSARFEFEGDDDNELALEEGDVVRIVERVGDEWLRGELKGRQGIFPVSFVEIIEDLPPEEDTASAAAALPSKESKSDSMVKALYDFEGQDGELSFQVGDEIEVLQRVNADWLFGKLHGQRGQFPASFVSHIPDGLEAAEEAVAVLNQEDDRPPSQALKTEVTRRGQIEHRTSKGQRSETSVRRRVEEVKMGEEKPKVKEVDKDFKAPGIHLKSREEVLCVVRAMHNYEDPPLGDLPFKEGDMIDVVEFIGEDWGRGWLEGKEGLFPLSFVAELEEVPPLPEPEPEKKFGRVLHDFEAQGPDDLTLKEGDVVELEDIADTQGNWRWGRLDGRRGMFPAVFVEEMGSSVQTVV